MVQVPRRREALAAIGRRPRAAGETRLGDEQLAIARRRGGGRIAIAEFATPAAAA
jgi:hypothetical protein